ncbi:hypothetical protein Tco_1228016 [Tanacetum coccineum]
MGCSTFSPPFNYLRIKVGAPMSRLNSWKEITAKISSWLSKWKLKTLSILGRYTLLKSVLTTIPIYHMSLFKVPAGNLKEMESVQRNFFNGVERSEKKMVNIYGLASLKPFMEINVLSTIQIIHLEPQFGFDLIHEFSSLCHKGIDLIALVKRKLGNGENTLFGEVIWLGDSSLKTKLPRLFALEGGAEDEQYKDLCSNTSEVLLPNMLDRWAWSLNASWDFPVSSVHTFIDDVFLPKSEVPTRWVKMVPIKINIIA